MSEQLTALQRIAVFSARLRGHELATWTAGEACASARCIRCGAEVRVYLSLIQPEMDGAALDCLCGEGAAKQAA